MTKTIPYGRQDISQADIERIPMYSTLADAEQAKVIRVLHEVLV